MYGYRTDPGYFRSFAPETPNLLMLWYNLHVFERGKRKGHSPFDLARVVVRNPAGEPTTDWIDALGYAQAA